MDFNLFDSSYGAVEGFSNDNLAALQAAINDTASKGQGLWIDGKFGIAFTSAKPSIDVPSNAYIKFLPGAALKLLYHDLENYDVFKVSGKSNVTIENAVIDGSKEMNSATTGEWGMGIGLYDASNVTIIDPVITNTWGDGIYVGGASKCTGIKIYRPYIGGCRRNGMSVISADGLDVYHPTFERINDTNPKAGIDFEPNDNNAELKNINIYSPRTIYCNLGIEFYLSQLPGPKAKVVSVNIYDYVSINDGEVLNFLALAKGSYSVSGTIKVNGVRYIKPNFAGKTITNWDNSIALAVTNETTVS